MLVFIVKVLYVALINYALLAEKRKGSLGRNLNMLPYLSCQLLPLRISVDQESNLILLVLILFRIFFEHNGIKDSICTVEFREIGK